MDDLTNPLGSVNPRAFDVGAQPQGQPPPIQSAPAPTSPSQPVPPATAMAQSLQAADTEHHSQLGKAFRSIMGNDISYQIDPQTGKMVQTEVPQKPGQLWRGIIAATILGGATASKNKAPGFIQGAAEGGGAVIDKAEQQDKEKRANAQQDFKNQMTARSANTEDDLKRAQIAFHNAQTLHENKLMQMQDYNYHKEVADTGKKQLQPYIDADPTLVKFQDVPETKMNDLMKGNPQASELLWEPTGTRIVVGADGKPNVEATYSAVDPTKNVKVTNDQIQHWKDAGIDQVYGKATWDVLTNNKELPATTYMAINQKSQELTNKKMADKKTKLDAEKEEAAVAMTKAQTSHFKAEAAKLYADENDKKAANEAFDILSSGKDISKISIKGRKLLVDGLNSVIKSNVDELKALSKDPTTNQPADQDKAKELYNTMENYQKIVDRLYGIKPAEPAGVGASQSKTSEAVQNIGELLNQDGVELNSTKAYDYISKRPVSKERDEAIKKYALVPWKAISDRAAREGVTRNKAAQKFKSEGYKVQYSSDEEYEKSVEGVFPHP